MKPEGSFEGLQGNVLTSFGSKPMPKFKLVLSEATPNQYRMESEKQLNPPNALKSPLHSATEEILYCRDEQLCRWVGHFPFLYSSQNIVTYAALDHMESLPTMYDLNSVPTLEELSRAIT